MVFQDQLMRPSLGRVAFIGELYDIRSESLSCLSLMKNPFPQNLVQRTNLGQMKFEYKFTENLSDRCELVDVEAELQLSVLFGLIKLEGSGKFLGDEKMSEKAISCSLACQIQTVNEKFFASFDEVLEHVDLNLLGSNKYTHMITEINWGANCLLNLEFDCQSESRKGEIQGRLAAEFSKLKLISVKGNGQLDTSKSSLLKQENIKIKVFADVLPENTWPVTVEDFFKFVRDVPNLLRSVNDGKGKPINYKMIPLETLRKLTNLESAFNVVVRNIDESFLLSTLYLFGEILQIKQQLHDLFTLMSERKKYVKEERLKEVRRMKDQLVYKESEFKSLISGHWVAVRSGDKTMKDLIMLMEKFKNKELSLSAYKEYMESLAPEIDKLSFISEQLSHGILYLGKEEKFHSVQSKYLSCEFIILVTSSEMEKEDPELHKNTLYYFLTLAAEAKENTKYVIVDFDFTPEETFFDNRVTVTKCFHLNGIKPLSRDLFAEYLQELESNFVRLQEGSKMLFCQHKPGNRVILNMVCPGFESGTCSSDSLTWSCITCKKNIEFGFDNFYYCSCGKALAHNFEYRCNNSKHKGPFLSASHDFLENFLGKLRPLKEMNVLVLGQSGVGKSTWINSIINYLSYDSFEAARDSGVICTIPATFNIIDRKTFKKHVISVGEQSGNEVTESGHSATQQSRTYSFIWEDVCVRIIDTPGLGDSRGIEQDKKNLNNVIEHLGYMKEIHGVCILLKANDNRLNAIFMYCIKELLVHLHRSVTRNIVFCFTNSRTSLYSPGQSCVILERLIENLGIGRELGLGVHNMFCLDNEAFAFLCTLDKTNIQYEEVIFKSFVESWKISSGETKRLFETIKSFEPHLLKETLSLVKARNRILSLTKPIAEVSKTIQINLATMQRKKDEIKTSEMTLQELEKKVKFTEIQLATEPLPMPRTVCTSASCVNYLSYRDLDWKDIEYKTHCHPKCTLVKVTPKTTNNHILKDCWAMNGTDKCRVCGCPWQNHMHLTYSQKRVERTMENKYIKKTMMKEESEKKKIEEVVKNLQAEIEKYENEQEIILQASIKFGMFLKKNAITPYNDSVAEYLEYLIEEERKKPLKSQTEEKLIQKLNETLDYYNAEVKVLQEVMKENDGKAEEIMPEEVYELEQQLYKLELTGKQISESVQFSRAGGSSHFQYLEVPVQIHISHKKEVAKWKHTTLLKPLAALGKLFK